MQSIDSLSTSVNIRITDLEDSLNAKAERLTEEKLQLLRDILLVDDRHIANAIIQRIKEISESLETQEKLSQKIDRIIEKRLSQFVKEIPAILKLTITKTLQ
ncbi:MAG: hypothetical protein ACJAX3_002563 [Patiriisocius sp.]|jgi:hypothetical protein